MMFRRTPIAAAVSLTLMGLAGATLPATAAFAQTTAPATDAKKAEEARKAEEAKKQAVDTVVVTGIRASLEKSIDVKREADTNVEVVTAEDVGKMPDKNIADALSRLSGVNVQYGGALALDEAERVAIRGTSPNLNLTTVNGHALSSGDWHVGDQSSSGRSVGFGLMPSQLIGQAIVYKTGRADITEGGVAGTIDILTRKPLDFAKPLTGEISLGAVHAELAKKTDPQASGLLAWQNDARTFGVLLQAYREDRHLRRDGMETFSFGFITPAQAAASGNPTLANLRMPGSLNSALFKGVREREGGYAGLQWKPNRDIELNLSAFRTTLNADNYNSSGFALPTTLVANGWLISNAVVQGDVITSATLTRPASAPATQRVIGFQFDHNVREGATSLSSFYDLDGKWNVNDRLSFKGRVGYTEGSGKTNSQPSLTFGLINPNFSYTSEVGRPTDYRLTNANGTPIDLSSVSSYVQMSNTGAAVKSTDKENYLHLDGDYKIDRGIFGKLKFGLRAAEHKREYEVIGARWNAQDGPNGPITPSPFVSVTGGLLVTNIVGNNIPVPATAYPGNYAANINANFPRNLFRFDPAQIQAFANSYVNWDPVRNKVWSSGYTVKEKNDAAYVMQEFDWDKVTGNVGLRAVRTEVTSTAYQALPSGTGVGQCVVLQPCAVPGAIVGSLFATYLPQTTKTEHNVLLPSANLRWEIEPKLIARFAASKTLGRPNYNELAGAVSLNNTLLTGSSGNPLLKPTVGINVDASLAYYFSRRGYVSGGIFAQSLKDYVKPGVSNVEFFNTSTGTNSIYAVTSRVQVAAKLRGAELAAETPIGGGFGLGANVTYVDGKDRDGIPFLGTSRLTYNVNGYYEDDRLSARLAWNYRTDYAIGLVVAGTTTIGTHRYDDAGSLSGSVSYKLSERFSVTLDGNNLLNPVRHTYYITPTAPGYWHENGRQFFLSLRAKF